MTQPCDTIREKADAGVNVTEGPDTLNVPPQPFTTPAAGLRENVATHPSHVFDETLVMVMLPTGLPLSSVPT